MAETPTPEQDRDALAAELALGLLDGQERADALRLRLSDSAFSAQVAAWEAKLSPLYGEYEATEPDSGVWSRIEVHLGGIRPTNVSLIEKRLHRWRGAALLSGAVAAALALLLLVQPAPAPDPVAPQLAVARIEGDAAGPVAMARYNRSSGVMRLQVVGIEAGALVPELWVIPAGGDPVSLGQFTHVGSAEIILSAPHRPLLQDGATLAITMEPVSQIPHPAPTSAPVAAGKIIAI